MKVDVLTGSVVAALLASVVLRLRNREYRRIRAVVSEDADANDIPRRVRALSRIADG